MVASTVYTYDHANRMTGIVDSNSTGTTLVSYGYTYDAADRVTQEVLTWDSGTEADTITYSYTNNNQLTGVTHTNNSFANESFTWDANGNETGTGYTTGTDNEQTASPGYSYTYDNAGNMTSETNTSNGDVWTYSYNSIGEMTGAVEKTSGGTTLESVTYTYDALGNRIGMDENGTQTWTLYDGGNPIMDFNGSGSLTMRYLWGPMGIVARQTSGGTVSWYLADALGSVRDLINNSGAIIDHLDFSAFGTVLDQSDPSEGDRMMGFAGMEQDTVTGLNLAVFREENPGTGRWDSQDPLGFSEKDTNLFRYAINSPTNFTDPTGLAPTIVIYISTIGAPPGFNPAVVQAGLQTIMNSGGGKTQILLVTTDKPESWYRDQYNLTLGWNYDRTSWLWNSGWWNLDPFCGIPNLLQYPFYMFNRGKTFYIGYVRFVPAAGPIGTNTNNTADIHLGAIDNSSVLLGYNASTNILYANIIFHELLFHQLLGGWDNGGAADNAFDSTVQNSQTLMQLTPEEAASIDNHAK